MIHTIQLTAIVGLFATAFASVCIAKAARADAKATANAKASLEEAMSCARTACRPQRHGRRRAT